MSALDGILSLGRAFTEGMIDRADKYSKDDKFSPEQREYYGNLSEGLRNSLDKISEKTSKKMEAPIIGTVNVQDYTQEQLKAMALMEPFFGVYRKKYSENWIFFDNASAYHKAYDIIINNCQSINWKPYIFICGKNKYIGSGVVLCDKGVAFPDQAIAKPYGHIDYVTIKRSSALDTTSIYFGSTRNPRVSFDICTPKNEREELVRKLYDFIVAINGKCELIEKKGLFP